MTADRRATSGQPQAVDEAEAGLVRGIAFALLAEAGVGAILGVVLALYLFGGPW